MGDENRSFSLATQFAEELRVAGGKLVEAKEYEAAVAKYTEAIGAFGRSAFSKGMGVCLTNRAIVCGKLGWWAESYCDARAAIQCFPKFAKAWFRAGTALEHLGVHRCAGVAYYAALELDESLYATATPAIERCRKANIKARHDNALPQLAASSSPRREEEEEEGGVVDVASTEPVWFGLGPGRCGLHSLAALANDASSTPRAQCLSRAPDFRLLLWNPTESRRAVARRRLAARPLGDVNYAWLPYARDILDAAPNARFVVLRRDPATLVESWFSWTEAGSARSVPGIGSIAVHAHAKNPWTWHDQTLFDFDEWDLTLPKYEGISDKREAISRYVDDYYDECDRLKRDFPDRVRNYDVPDLFASPDLKRDLFDFLRIQDDPPDQVFHENKQLYVYADAKGDLADFVPGDFARARPDDSSELSSDDEDEEGKEELRAIRDDPARREPHLTLTVPDDARPGDSVRFTLRGRSVDAVVPRDKRPGDTFHIPSPFFRATAAAAGTAPTNPPSLDDVDEPISTAPTD